MQSAAKYTLNHKVTTDNWTHTQYVLDNLRALISLGASWEKPAELIYLVTLLDENDQEVFQQEFKTLESACDYINKRYQDEWPIVDLMAPASKEGGCASCVAH